MKYKVGDKVRVRKDLVIDSVYGGDSFTEGMAMFRGKVVTISKILNNGKYYILEDDSECAWSWTNEMFEGLANEAQPEEAEKAINLLREMKHNCEHANKYDDPKRYDKAKALGFAIELIEHDCSAVELNMEKLSNQSDDSNSMAKGSHYEKSAMQPLEVSQVLLTKEQFEGALIFNIIKYRMRKKGQDEADEYKARQYAYWLELVDMGQTINPTKDKVPDSYKFKVV